MEQEVLAERSPLFGHLIVNNNQMVTVAPKQVGTHWGSGTDEINVLTENVDGSHWFGECKWWDAPVGENLLNRLIENATKVPDRWKHNPRYLLFSVSGFTDALKQRAAKEGVFLIEANDLF